MRKPKQSPAVKDLKAQLLHTDGPQLPPMWKNPNKVVAQITKEVKNETEND